MFFSRSDCCCHREHHHTWRSFRRGMVAMFVLAFAVLGLLDYSHGHHPHRATHHSGAVTSSHSKRGHRDRPRHAGEPHARPCPAPTSHHTTRHPGSASHRPSPAGDTSLATAGQGVIWTDFHGIPLPVSASAGPRYRSHGLASGFADTPRGALLAAINI